MLWGCPASRLPSAAEEGGGATERWGKWAWVVACWQPPLSGLPRSAARPQAREWSQSPHGSGASALLRWGAGKGSPFGWTLGGPQETGPLHVHRAKAAGGGLSPPPSEGTSSAGVSAPASLFAARRRGVSGLGVPRHSPPPPVPQHGRLGPPFPFHHTPKFSEAPLSLPSTWSGPYWVPLDPGRTPLPPPKRSFGEAPKPGPGSGGGAVQEMGGREA